MLVQFFFRELAPVHNIFNWTAPKQPLQVNGSPDENLYTYIHTFQGALKGLGYPVAADDRIDPARGARTQRSSITHTIYTIVLLNNWFESMFPQRFLTLPKDSAAPLPLQKALTDKRV